MERSWAESFAQRWVSDWNSHDIEAVLAHFADDVVFTSPLAARVVPGSGGVVRGKEALRAYWNEAFSRVPDLRLELVSLFVGVNTVVIGFRNQKGDLRGEVLEFEDGLVVRGHATELVFTR